MHYRLQLGVCACLLVPAAAMTQSASPVKAEATITLVAADTAIMRLAVEVGRCAGYAPATLELVAAHR